MAGTASRPGLTPAKPSDTITRPRPAPPGTGSGHATSIEGKPFRRGRVQPSHEAANSVMPAAPAHTRSGTPEQTPHRESEITISQAEHGPGQPAVDRVRSISAETEIIHGSSDEAGPAEAADPPYEGVGFHRAIRVSAHRGGIERETVCIMVRIRAGRHTGTSVG